MSDSRAKVVHFSSVHRASDTRIFVKECRSLAEAGYDVTLVALAKRDEVKEGVKIIAVETHSGNRFRRMTETVLDVYRKAHMVNGDIYHFHDPELIPAGVLLKLQGKRVIYDVHESVAKQIQSKYWIPSVLRTPVATAYRLVERLATSVFDGIVAATPGVAKGFPPRKTVVVQNFARIEEFASIDTSDYESRPVTVTYIGGITRARGIQEMVDAMDLLEDDATLILGGAFAPAALHKEIQQRPGYRNVEFRGWLSRDVVRETLASARVGLLVLHPEPNYVDSYPVKLFEYMAAGIPVVASHFPFWKQFVGDTGAGLMVDPQDVEKIADSLQWLLTNPAIAGEMGARGRQAVQDRYNWELEKAKLVRLYERIMGRPFPGVANQ